MANMMRFVTVFLIVTITSSAQGFAGVLEGVEKGACSYRFSGEIKNGDERLFDQIVFDRLRSAEGGSGLCLSSEGGSFDAALKIAQLLIENGGFPTHVLENDKCLSACAFIFMAGRDCGGECDLGLSVAREIAPGATVGFHAPYLNLTEEAGDTFDRKTVQAAYGVALSQISRLMAFTDERLQGVPVIPPRFLERILAVGPKQILTIDTISDAIESGIDIRLTNYPLKLNDDQILHVCDNLMLSHYVDAGYVGVRELYHEAVLSKRKITVRKQNEGQNIFVVDGYPNHEDATISTKSCTIHEEINIESSFGSDFALTGFLYNSDPNPVVNNSLKPADVESLLSSVPSWYMFEGKELYRDAGFRARALI